jgi:hypothetical protein
LRAQLRISHETARCTRLCAVFHNHFPELVGPVRSIRPVGVPLLSPLRSVFGNTAAAYWVWKVDKIFTGRGAPDPVVSTINGQGSFTSIRGPG